MTERKKSLLGVLIIFGIFVLISGIIYAVSTMPVTANQLSSFVEVKAAVNAEEIQDENGKFILLDFPETADLAGYITLGDYKNMTITEIPVYQVSEEDIQDNIDSYIRYYQKYIPVTEGTIVTGDPITVSYTGYLDDVKMDDYVAEERVLQLGYAGEPAEFTNALHGTEIGTELDFDVNMPEDWGDSAVAGKQMHFHVLVHNKLTIPELTDDTVEFITDGEYKTANDFREHLRERIAVYYDQTRQGEISDAIIDKLDHICQFGTPDHELVKWYVSILMKYYQDYADSQGISIDEMISSFGLAISIDDLMKTMCEEALTELPYQLVLTAIARDAGITVDLEADADLIAERKLYLIDQFGYADEEELIANYRESNLMHDILSQKTLDWLCTIVKQVPEEKDDESATKIDDTVNGESVVSEVLENDVSTSDTGVSVTENNVENHDNTDGSSVDESVVDVEKVEDSGESEIAEK